MGSIIWLNSFLTGFSLPISVGFLFKRLSSIFRRDESYFVELSDIKACINQSKQGRTTFFMGWYETLSCNSIHSGAPLSQTSSCRPVNWLYCVNYRGILSVSFALSTKSSRGSQLVSQSRMNQSNAATSVCFIFGTRAHSPGSAY